MLISVVIVEDDRKTREGLVRIVRGTNDLSCACAYSSGEEALPQILDWKPCVVLMDINLPKRSGISCAAELKERRPELAILMLTVCSDPTVIFESLRAGASGYILKRDAPEKLAPAVREVHAGGAPMSPSIAREVIRYFHEGRNPRGEVAGLSKREYQILSHLARGFFYKEIAAQLGIGVSTVATHLHTIYRKLHVQSRTEAVLKYLEQRE